MQPVELKLNPAKKRFKTPKVNFTGFQLRPEGVSPAPTMVDAILSMPNAEFPYKALSNLSDVVKGLREFTHKVVPFQWTDSQDKAFVESKMLNAQDPVLCHLNPQLPITQQVDVSNWENELSHNFLILLECSYRGESKLCLGITQESITAVLVKKGKRRKGWAEQYNDKEKIWKEDHFWYSPCLILLTMAEQDIEGLQIGQIRGKEKKKKKTTLR